MGSPSYEESVRGLTVTGDLIATIYRGLKSYAQIQRLGGNEEPPSHYESKAEEYARLYNTGWWNEETQNYYAYKLENENLKEGGCNVFPLWFRYRRQAGTYQSFIGDPVGERDKRGKHVLLSEDLL